MDNLAWIILLCFLHFLKKINVNIQKNFHFFNIPSYLIRRKLIFAIVGPLENISFFAFGLTQSKKVYIFGVDLIWRSEKNIKFVADLIWRFCHFEPFASNFLRTRFSLSKVRSHGNKNYPKSNNNQQWLYQEKINKPVRYSVNQNVGNKKELFFIAQTLVMLET